MRFPLAIFKEKDSSYGVIVPDIAGCFSAGDTVDQAIENAKEAMIAHIDLSIEKGLSVEFIPSPIDILINKLEYASVYCWVFVEIEETLFDLTPERVNISVPRFMLRRIDAHAAIRRKTRSAFLVETALEYIRREEANLGS